MTYRLTHGLIRLAATLLLILALAATGFAHRAPSAQDATVQLAQAMGGLSGFCGHVPTGDRPGHVKCPACQLTDTVALPPPATLPGSAPRLLAAVATATVQNPFRPVLDPARASRAPPLA